MVINYRIYIKRFVKNLVVYRGISEIDVLEARIQFFEAKDDYHSLDYKFKNGTRIADLEDKEEWFSVQSTAATTIIISVFK